ncbi:MAG: peptide-methionine (S)-S-oxide reductase MsrA [Candidatus Thioglobus sp.]|uniref:peptide-methionine (S)-S-oxide reductase MsrA n=1 Tax=Candidatus Thioglobus sp. TaxID=2026721 RepID=UPI002634AB0E|nr:peptide-methionine (S)-S-oxide reductase MsrA [Candidatus Thioglobus sp.]MDC9727191.1 peptide-methionine (S)-S-oxide reductase MsrA [Candidatus Thioglobus sp.]
MQTAYFAGGCFWCVEAVFQRIDGVLEVTSGYCNGTSINPTYQEICTGTTGHAEVVKIAFDETLVSFNELLAVFFATHDATTLNQQGNDKGTQYRSAVFYIDANQQLQVESFIKTLNGVVTEVSKLDTFYPAEDYHQNYYNNHSNQPYCQALIAPKLAKYFNE